MIDFARTLLHAAVAIAFLSQAGCATIVSGQQQRVSIESQPSGAKATVLPEGTELVTPAEIKLSRGAVHTIVFELPGYRPQYGFFDRAFNGMVYGNYLLGGLIGILIDLSSDAAFKLTPDSLDVVLEKAPAPALPGPLGIEEQPNQY